MDINMTRADGVIFEADINPGDPADECEGACEGNDSRRIVTGVDHFEDGPRAGPIKPLWFRH
jgi:hypothetical protein